MTNETRQHIIKLLDLHAAHLQRLKKEGTPQDAENQRIYYEGIFTAYDHLLIGSGYVLTRTKAGSHQIEKRVF